MEADQANKNATFTAKTIWLVIISIYFFSLVAPDLTFMQVEIIIYQLVFLGFLFTMWISYDGMANKKKYFSAYAGLCVLFWPVTMPMYLIHSKGVKTASNIIGINLLKLFAVTGAFVICYAFLSAIYETIQAV